MKKIYRFFMARVGRCSGPRWGHQTPPSSPGSGHRDEPQRQWVRPTARHHRRHNPEQTPTIWPGKWAPDTPHQRHRHHRPAPLVVPAEATRATPLYRLLGTCVCKPTSISHSCIHRHVSSTGRGSRSNKQNIESEIWNISVTQWIVCHTHKVCNT